MPHFSFQAFLTSSRALRKVGSSAPASNLACTSAHAPTKEGPSFAKSSSEARPPPATAAAEVKGDGDDDEGVEDDEDDDEDGVDAEDEAGRPESGLPNGYTEEGAGLDLGDGVAAADDDDDAGLLPLFDVLMGLWPRSLLLLLFASTLDPLSLPLPSSSSSFIEPVSTATDSLQVLMTGRIARTRNS